MQGCVCVRTNAFGNLQGKHVLMMCRVGACESKYICGCGSGDECASGNSDRMVTVSGAKGFEKVWVLRREGEAGAQQKCWGSWVPADVCLDAKVPAKLPLVATW